MAALMNAGNSRSVQRQRASASPRCLHKRGDFIDAIALDGDDPEVRSFGTHGSRAEARLAITSSGCVAPASVLNGSAIWALRAAAGTARLLRPGGAHAVAAPIGPFHPASRRYSATRA
jgi:hypothetical protein